ncbi:hypothetical protein PAHAL_3G486900 [Panicum hallii]|uniref:BHLH domain-containing protein n=1 Tax=Panicum hallii TaxID=206008 RepID=A0A2S3HF90_9POAL|nr:putative transcription factor bHLH056 [Panicum hallii]PAN21759.1 hypothetical protein PAHAL_3G486900 [Panicum hallii]
MNCPGHAAGPRWCYPDDSGEAAGGDAVDMIADYYSTADDLFELVSKRGGGGAGGAPGLRTMQPAAESCHWSPPPEVRFEPPSEGQMAAWLGTIVRGEELAVDDGGGRDVPAAKKRSSDNASTTTDSKEKLIPVTEGIGTMQEMRKAPASGGSSRRSHNLTEKRRRNKINERFKTLQQLVPGCDKSNQASTLDQTIQYMKSLQQHVQAMSVGPARPAAAAAVPVVQPRYAPPEAPPVAVQMMPAAPVILAPAPTTMVPFGAMLHQMPHYPAAVPVMMPASASAALLSYPAAPPPRAAAVEPGGAGSSASRRHGSSSRKGKGGRRLRQKH